MCWITEPHLAQVDVSWCVPNELATHCKFHCPINIAVAIFKPTIAPKYVAKIKLKKKFCSICFRVVECPLLLFAVRSLLPTPFLRGDTAFIISLLSSVLPFTMWFNASQYT